MSIVERLRQILTKQRCYASYFEWPDKPRKELGIVERLLESMELAGERTYISPQTAEKNPPDCVATDQSGGTIAIEVRELVSEEAIRRNQKGDRVYRDWQPGEVIREIETILREKDAKRYHGGPYSKIVVIIHTDELTISYETYASLLASHVFNKLRQVNEAFFLFSYDPRVGRCPFVRMRLSGADENVNLGDKWGRAFNLDNL